jgi:hypothetical protein
VLHLHDSSGDVVVPEAFPELDPSECVAVPSWVCDTQVLGIDTH